MPDFGSKQFEASLANTVRWCQIKAVGMHVSEEVRQRHALHMQAEQQWEEAQQLITPDRKIGDTKQFQNAMRLLKQIRDSVGPMHRNLRSPELMPVISLDGFEQDATWARAVAEVVGKRSRLTSEVSSGNDCTKIGGRLLLYNPSENLACGGAEAFSNGFFDVNNTPPWDLWVDFSDGTLVSWVPPALVNVAQMGIYVNPEQCIRWASQ